MRGKNPPLAVLCGDVIDSKDSANGLTCRFKADSKERFRADRIRYTWDWFVVIAKCRSCQNINHDPRYPCAVGASLVNVDVEATREMEAVGA